MAESMIYSGQSIIISWNQMKSIEITWSHMDFYLSINRSINQSTYLSIDLSIDLSFFLSILMFLSIYLSIYLSYLPIVFRIQTLGPLECVLRFDKWVVFMRPQEPWSALVTVSFLGYGVGRTWGIHPTLPYPPGNKSTKETSSTLKCQEGGIC